MKKVKGPATNVRNTRRPGLSGIRFNPDPGTFAAVIFGTAEKNWTLWGLVLNESAKGFAMVATHDSEPIKESVGLCRVGSLPDLRGTVRWVQKLDEDLYKIGFEYNE